MACRERGFSFASAAASAEGATSMPPVGPLSAASPWTLQPFGVGVEPIADLLDVGLEISTTPRSQASFSGQRRADASLDSTGAMPIGSDGIDWSTLRHRYLAKSPGGYHQVTLSSDLYEPVVTERVSPLRARERDLETRAMFRKRNFGTLATSWLVRNCFAEWRIIVCARIADLAYQQKRDLVVPDVDVCLQRRFVVRRVIGDVAAQLLQRWAFCTLRLATCKSRLGAQLTDLKASCESRLSEMQHQHRVDLSNVELQLELSKQEWNQVWERRMQTELSSKHAQWAIQADEKRASLEKDFEARLKHELIAVEREVEQRCTRRAAELEERYRTQLATVEKSSEVTRLSDVARVEEECEARLHVEREYVTSLQAELAALRADFDARYKGLQLECESSEKEKLRIVEQTWSDRLRKELAGCEKEWEAKLRRCEQEWKLQLQDLEDEAASKLQRQANELDLARDETSRMESAWQTKLEALQRDADTRLKRQATDLELACEERLRLQRDDWKLKLQNLTSETEERLQRQARDLEFVCEEKLRRERASLDESWQAKLARELSRLQTECETKLAQELTMEEREAESRVNRLDVEWQTRHRQEVQQWQLKMSKEAAEHQRALDAEKRSTMRLRDTIARMRGVHARATAANRVWALAAQAFVCWASEARQSVMQKRCDTELDLLRWETERLKRFLHARGAAGSSALHHASLRAHESKILAVWHAFTARALRTKQLHARGQRAIAALLGRSHRGMLSLCLAMWASEREICSLRRWSDAELLKRESTWVSKYQSLEEVELTRHLREDERRRSLEWRVELLTLRLHNFKVTADNLLEQCELRFLMLCGFASWRSMWEHAVWQRAFDTTMADASASSRRHLLLVVGRKNQIMDNLTRTWLLRRQMTEVITNWWTAAREQRWTSQTDNGMMEVAKIRAVLRETIRYWICRAAIASEGYRDNVLLLRVVFDWRLHAREARHKQFTDAAAAQRLVLESLVDTVSGKASAAMCHHVLWNLLGGAFSKWVLAILLRRCRSQEEYLLDFKNLFACGYAARVNMAQKVWFLQVRLLLFAVFSAWRQYLVLKCQRAEVLQLTYQIAEYEDSLVVTFLKDVVKFWRHYTLSLRHKRLLESFRARGGVDLIRIEGLILTMDEQRQKMRLWKTFARWRVLAQKPVIIAQPPRIVRIQEPAPPPQIVEKVFHVREPPPPPQIVDRIVRVRDPPPPPQIIKVRETPPPPAVVAPIVYTATPVVPVTSPRHVASPFSTRAVASPVAVVNQVPMLPSDSRGLSSVAVPVQPQATGTAVPVLAVAPASPPVSVASVAVAPAQVPPPLPMEPVAFQSSPASPRAMGPAMMQASPSPPLSTVSLQAASPAWPLTVEPAALQPLPARGPSTSPQRYASPPRNHGNGGSSPKRAHLDHGVCGTSLYRHPAPQGVRTESAPTVRSFSPDTSSDTTTPPSQRVQQSFDNEAITRPILKPITPATTIGSSASASMGRSTAKFGTDEPGTMEEPVTAPLHLSSASSTTPHRRRPFDSSRASQDDADDISSPSLAMRLAGLRLRGN